MADTKIIRVGLDFDGVVTYNPMRIARLLVSFVKHKIIKVKKLGFFAPKNYWQKVIFFMAVVIPSLWPANGAALLRKLSKSSEIEFYLITGRYGFVKENTISWLKRFRLLDVFKKIFINDDNLQPHEFKMNIIDKQKFDYYIEDNLDVVKFLYKNCPDIKTLWIYNIVDRNNKYVYKFPDLRRALEKIIEDENIN